MNAADLSLIVLAALFAATALPRFHLGLAAFPAAFIVAHVAGIDMDTLVGFFPADFFILIVGVTSLFAIAQMNGTMDWILQSGLRLLGGRVALIPWMIFALTGLMTGVGTLPTAAMAIMAPIAMGFSARFGITPFLTALVAVLGMIAGMFSPIAVFGLTAANLYDRAGVATPDSLPLTLMLASLVTGVLLCSAYVFVDRIVRLQRERVAAPVAVPVRSGGTARQSASDGDTIENLGGGRRSTEVSITVPIALTVTAVVSLVVCAVGFDLNVGFVGLTLTTLLQIGLRIEPSDVISRIPWAVVVLIGGILTYIGVMQELGAFDRLAEFLSVDGSPMVSLLIICYIAGVTSFFASSISVFTTAVPLLPPLIAAGVNPVGALIAVAMSSILVDINPIGPTGGYLMAATAPEARGKLFRQLLIYGIASVIVIPPLSVVVYGWI